MYNTDTPPLLSTTWLSTVDTSLRMQQRFLDSQLLGHGRQHQPSVAMRVSRRTHHDRRSAARRKDTPQQGTRAMMALRQRYFAQAGTAASHFGISFDRIIHHLWDARRRHQNLSIRAITYVDDLVYAVACLDDSDQAWHELAELYEPWLVRRFRSEIGIPAAVLVVRQVLVSLRRAEPDETANSSLHDYLGMQPLREWLTGRVHQHLSRRAAAGPATAVMIPAQI